MATITRDIFNGHVVKYSNLGWQIFPLAVGAKVPMAGSGGLRDATSNRAQVDHWRANNPHANIGLLCGELSGVIVIDMDPRNGSQLTVAQLARQRRVFPDTVEVATPSGGRHLYYAFDKRTAQSGSNKLGPGIDVSSNGHYVVLPPSFWDQKQECYRWVRPPRGATFQPLPKWVFEVLAPRPAPGRRQGPAPRIEFGKLHGYHRQAVADLDRAVQFASNLRDGRHEAPFKVGATLGAYVHHGLLTKDDLERAIMSACEANGALAKYNAMDLLNQIGNGLQRARADSLPPLARIHGESQAMGTVDEQAGHLDRAVRPAGHAHGPRGGGEGQDAGRCPHLGLPGGGAGQAQGRGWRWRQAGQRTRSRRSTVTRR